MYQVILEKLDTICLLRKLNDEMDIRLPKLLKDFFASGVIPFPLINLALLNDFENDAFGYFDRGFIKKSRKITHLQDYLFNNLTVIPKIYVRYKLFTDAQDFWIWILNIVNKWESSREKRIHKGSIYYFWAEVTLLSNEIDKGFFLVHEAYKEDCITYRRRNTGTPAYRTVHFNYLSKANLLYPYVKELWGYLIKSLDVFNKRNHRNLGIRRFHSNFIKNPRDDDTLFSFTHLIAKIYQLCNYPPNIIESDFVGLYELNLLFGFILILDNLLNKNTYSRGYQEECSKAISGGKNPPTKIDWYFFEESKYLLMDSNLEPISIYRQNNIKAVNESQKNNFEKTVSELLNMKFNFPHPINVTPLYCDVCLCLCIRNFCAHNISLNNTISTNFKEIVQRVLNVLFLIVDTY